MNQVGDIFTGTVELEGHPAEITFTGNHDLLGQVAFFDVLYRFDQRIGTFIAKATDDVGHIHDANATSEHIGQNSIKLIGRANARSQHIPLQHSQAQQADNAKACHDIHSFS